MIFRHISGAPSIQQFLLEKLPPTKHEIISLDAQPVHDAAVHGQTTIMVTTAGSVRFLGKGNKKEKNFQQNFLITAQGDHWKVANETFRYKDPA